MSSKFNNFFHFKCKSDYLIIDPYLTKKSWLSPTRTIYRESFPSVMKGEERDIQHKILRKNNKSEVPTSLNLFSSRSPTNIVSEVWATRKRSLPIILTSSICKTKTPLTKNFLKKNFMAPFFMDGVQLPQG